MGFLNNSTLPFIALIWLLGIRRYKLGRISIFARFSVSSTTLGFTSITPKGKKRKGGFVQQMKTLSAEG
jgi:hypothetical protein